MHSMTIVIRLAKFTFLAAWLFLLYQQYDRTKSLSPLAQAVDLAKTDWEPSTEETWMGVYYKGKKIGYSTHTVTPQADRYEVLERAYLSPRVLGEQKEIRTSTRAILDRDYVLKEVHFKMESGPVDFFLTGHVEGKKLYVRLHGGKDATGHTIDLSDEPRLPVTVRSLIGRKRIRPGDRYKIGIFDPSIVGQTELQIEVVGVEEIEHAGAKVEAYKLHETVGTVESWSWVTEEGQTLKEESPMGFTLLRESREDALSKGWPTGENVDLIASTAIPVSRYIEHPNRLKEIEMRVQSSAVGRLAGLSPRQEVDGSLVTIRRERSLSDLIAPLPLKGRELAPYLRPEPLIPSDDQEIKFVAQGALGKTQDGYGAVKRLAEFVYLHLEKVPLVSVPDGKQVLKLRKGDCNEHAVLFATLGRAAGLPTKVAVGVVYSQGSFFYHAWNEVFLRDRSGHGRWIAIDSTFNQVPADVTHMKMAEGSLEKQLQVMSFIGNTQIEILRAEE